MRLLQASHHPEIHFPGRLVLYLLFVFTVSDASGSPRNKVCVLLYTDGFWYTNATSFDNN